MVTQSYYAYWGKALSSDTVEHQADYHLLVYHSLDVAAVGRQLVSLPFFSLQPLATALGWTLSTTQSIACFFLAAHDIGKFARSFQGLAPDLSPELVPSVKNKLYTERHDTLGWVLWEALSNQDPPLFSGMQSTFWQNWIKSCVGHHGKPPKDSPQFGSLSLESETHFCPEDIDAAKVFLAEISTLLVPEWPEVDKRQRQLLKDFTWYLAGIAVLADWIGSNRQIFKYSNEVMPLPDYWKEYAIPRAIDAVQLAGFSHTVVQQLSSPKDLFDYLQHMTPLQKLAHDFPLANGPQLFLLEDVTGAGKTEAALMLVYRLLAAGHAHGLYFGLPTMATANQMFERVGNVYRHFYENSHQISLVLAHGARRMIEEFQKSILAMPAVKEEYYGHEEKNATAQCHAWLADTHKKALLAQVGVGTLDQALLGVLPVRHQSLRVLGLSSKVLVVDEVHAYDVYMQGLLEKLLTAHAQQGGSAILLSATLPSEMRRKLVQAFQKGLGISGSTVEEDSRYPLLTHAEHAVQSETCDTRQEVRRSVQMQWIHDVEDVLGFVIAQANEGKSVCWIRNTVTDARSAWQQLRDSGKTNGLTLFHSRFAMGDRLTVQDDVLQRFGKRSTQGQRNAQILIATQVVEQSLDLDFDVLVTDLAPIDLLIQRAGRLHRHVRDKHGNPAQQEGRASPVLTIFAPEYSDEPKADWYDTVFPKATYVYPDTGKLWLTQRALQVAGKIISPGEIGEIGSVRQLVEAVYGPDAEQVPDTLQRASQKAEGKESAHRSQANFNAIKLEKGYCDASSPHWYEDAEVPTRLGEETVLIYLAKLNGDKLVPWIQAEQFAWENSSLRISADSMMQLSDAWASKFENEIEMLRNRIKLLENAVIIPLVENGSGYWVAELAGKKGKVRVVKYDETSGFVLEG